MQKHPLYRSTCFQVIAAIVIGMAPVHVHSETRFEAGSPDVEPGPMDHRRPVPPAR